MKIDIEVTKTLLKWQRENPHVTLTLIDKVFDGLLLKMEYEGYGICHDISTEEMQNISMLNLYHMLDKIVEDMKQQLYDATFLHKIKGETDEQNTNS